MLSLKGCLCVSHSLTHTQRQTHTQRTAGADNKDVLIQLWGNKATKKLIRLMLASPAPERAFVCVIRKNMGLDLRCCLGNDAHKTLLYDVDMFLNNRLAFLLMKQSLGKWRVAVLFRQFCFLPKSTVWQTWPNLCLHSNVYLYNWLVTIIELWHRKKITPLSSGALKC